MIVGGMDTLEYSVEGVDYLEMVGPYLSVFEGMKLDAQSQGSCSLSIGGVTMEATPAGIPNYAYGLKCKDFWVYFAQKEMRRNYPVWVKVLSGALWSLGQQDATESVKEWLQSVGLEQARTKVSRVDLAVDTDELTVQEQDRKLFMKRADKVGTFHEHNTFTGFQFGGGGPIVLRIYDKTAEILRSHKDWMAGVWMANGWNGERVWRVEFQCRRELLRELRVETIGDLETNLTEMWAYLTAKWFRMKGSRLGPVWERLQEGFGPIERVGVREKVLQGNVQVLKDMAKGIIKSIGAATRETDARAIAAELAAYAEYDASKKGSTFAKAVEARARTFVQPEGIHRLVSRDEWKQINERLGARTDDL